MKFETKAIRVGQNPDPVTGAVIVPVYQTSTYQQPSINKMREYEYSRTANPTRKALEDVLASLENGKWGLAFGSGMAATAAVFSILKSGDHVVACNDIYGGTFRLLDKVYKPLGIQTSYADVEDITTFERAIQYNTKIVWIESPTNPILKLVDIKGLAKICKKKKVLLAVDNTFLSPYFQRPIDLGADIVVHSTTKYIAGHSDIVGGAVVTSHQEAYEKIKFYQNAAGAVPGPWDCWLTIRGVKTLAIRMKEHEKNALAIARWLEKHPKISKVYYPGLTSHPQYKLAKKQMHGFGAMVSIEIKGGYKKVEKFSSRLKIMLLGESLGGVESLVCYPTKMSHASMTEKERLSRGITDNLIRLSIGIENIADLKEDLNNALK